MATTATISLPFGKYPKHFTWSVFKQNDGKLQRLKADGSRLSTDSFSAILILALFIMQTSLIYCTQDFRVEDGHVTSWCQGLCRPASKPLKMHWERGWGSPSCSCLQLHKPVHLGKDTVPQNLLCHVVMKTAIISFLPIFFLKMLICWLW